MTALVGVLNKHAVAIAADSAVTMGNTHKVVNSANKIFTLSKYHPVAIMTYNDASFMGVPWDIIIKEYRRDLKDKSFPRLKDYMDDFVDYLHRRHFFCDEDTQKFYLNISLNVFYDLCCKEICKEKNIRIDSLTSDLIEEKLNRCLSSNSKLEKCDEFKSYTLNDFLAYIGDPKKYIEKKIIQDHGLLMESFFHYFTTKLLNPFYTGLVFVGYGEEEIYPSLFSLDISMGIDNRLKYAFKDKAEITEHGSGAVIIPFAQIDVTQTIIRGINPSFQNIIYNVISKSLRAFSKKITDIIDSKPGNEDISNAIKKLPLESNIRNITSDIEKEMKKSYTDPLLSTVINLDKEDMANMAESFISLTSLVRRMQPDEETVGGPVDVAVISKGDGFIWIRRKHYFDSSLNTHFFNNYFR